jgi:hypothetical protein
MDSPASAGLAPEKAGDPGLPSDHHAWWFVVVDPSGAARGGIAFLQRPVLRSPIAMSPTLMTAWPFLVLRNSGHLVGGVVQDGCELVH